MYRPGSTASPTSRRRGGRRRRRNPQIAGRRGGKTGWIQKIASCYSDVGGTRPSRMGRPKDAVYLSLAAGPENRPLPDLEFQLIDQTEFSVPFNDIRLVESSRFVIPGLCTPEVRVKDKFLAQKNILPVKVMFQNGHALSEAFFVLNGRTTIEELAAKVHNKFALDAVTEIEVFADENVLLPYGKLMMHVDKEYTSSDGLVLKCHRVDPPAN